MAPTLPPHRESSCLTGGFTRNGRYQNISHVAVYAGNGYLVDASFSKGCVVFRPVYSIGEIVPRIIQDEASWSSFLNFSAVHYRMGFENASLIYAQRPYATMVETYNGWREKGRYVRKGSKGIAIIDSDHYRPYVDHVLIYARLQDREA